MICKEVHKKMNAYLNRELNKEELSGFELHLENCASCRQLIDEVKNTLAMVDSVPKLSSDPFMFTRIQAQLENKTENKPRVWKRVLQPVAITVVMLFSLYIGVSLGSKYYNDNIQYQAEEYIDSQDEDLYLNALAYESIESFLLTDE